MELWFTERQTSNLGITCKVKKTIYSEKTKYQQLEVVDTEQFGRMLLLDGAIQTTVVDEFVYHEMITHVPLFTHKKPETVLVIGGGDGGTIREVLKHREIKKAVLVEIDQGVVESSKRYLPEISCGLEDDRVDVVIGDGIEYIKGKINEFDIIIVDSTDPVGAAEGLFTKDFYQLIHKSLKEDGLFVAQTESPFFNKELIKRIYKDVDTVFNTTHLYLASIPTYPSGLWSFTMGSKKYGLKESIEVKGIDTKYFNSEIYKGCFMLPEFAKKLIME